MIYLLGWMMMLSSTILLSVKNGKILVYFVLLYLVTISFLRGNVGTDTVSYITIFEEIKDLDIAPFDEWGFKLLASLLVSFFEPELAVKLISVFFFILVTFFYIKSDKNEAFFLISYFLPIFSYSYSMNTLRIGLSAVIFILIIKILGNKIFYYVNFILSSFLLIMFHYSAILYLIILYFFKKEIFSKGRFIFLLISFFVIAFFIMTSNYMLIKFNMYTDYSSPGIFSGSRIVFPLIILIIGIWFDKFSFLIKKEITLKFILLIFLSLVLTQISYMGLRILDILSLSVPIYILLLYKEKKLEFNFYMKFAFIVASILNMVATYLGFINEYGLGSSPFLPYSFNEEYLIGI